MESESQLVGGRFLVQRTLREAHGLRTLFCSDTAAPGEAVVKAARPDLFPAAVARRLERTVEALRGGGANGFTAPCALGSERELRWVAAPWVPGPTLRERIERGPMPAREAAAVARDLFRALGAVHERGVLHGNVKPSNVVLTAGGAMLIDLGPSLLEISPEEPSAELVRHLSPEKAGALRREADQRADLYSAGAVLFECLAGRPPFTASQVGELLRQHLTRQPPALRGLGLDVPRALDEVVQRLLRKDPRDRYQGAAAVLHDLEEILLALDRGEDEPALTPGRRDPRRTLAEPAFVGRQAELRALIAPVLQARAGSGGLLLLEAESGGGKTRLLDELALAAARKGAWVLRAHGVDGAAGTARSVLSDLVATIAAEAAAADRLRARLGDLLSPLAAARDVSEPLDAPAALVALMSALGAADRPALLLLDDCQWIDDRAVALLARLFAQPPRHLAAVAAWRSEDVPAGHPLRALPAAHLSLAPLEPGEIERLAESMAGPLPGEVVPVLQQLCGGSPSLAVAVLNGMVEEGALLGAEDGWHIEPDALARAHSSRRAAAYLVRRFERLPAEVLRLLGAGAVLGKEFEVAEAAVLAGLADDAAAAALEQARRGHIVWPAADLTRSAFVHDRLREALLQRLAPEERRALHLRAAEGIEKRDRRLVFDLAHHFAEAGDEKRALPYALAAADELSAQGALPLAERHYRLVERAAGDAATRLRAAEALAAVLLARGETGEARQRLERALGSEEGGPASARLRAALGELCLRAGDAAGALAAAAAGLGSVGVDAEPALVSRLHRLRAGAHAARGSALRAWWAARKSRRLAAPDAAGIASGEAAAALALAAAGWHQPALARAESAVAGTAAGPIGVRAEARLARAQVLLGAARFADSLKDAREAARLFERCGDRFRALDASLLAASCLFRMGNVSASSEAAGKLHREAAALGHGRAACEAFALWAEASGGRVPPLPAEKEAPPDATARAAAARGDAIRLLADGIHDEAAARLEAACRLLPSLPGPDAARLLAWAATAFRQAAAHSPAAAPHRRAALLSAAAASARRGLRLARRFRADLPHLLRESGLVAAARGNQRGARRALDASLAEAEAQGQLHQRAQSLRARGDVGLLLGWPGAAEWEAAARQALRALHADFPLYGSTARSLAPATVSLAERFETVLKAGRRIATSLTREQVYAGVREAAVQLLRAERCRVLEVAPDRPAPEMISVDRSDADSGHTSGFSRTLAARALAAGRPVVMAEEVPSAESVLYSGVRSALCAPILVRGQAVACFAVSSQQIGGLFGEEEEQLAGFIATLAGSALENAANFAELRELSRSLEQRVQERTSELLEANRSLERSLRELGETRGRLEEKVTELTETRDQLVRSEKLALAGQLAGGVAHEINNPLAFVASNFELLHELLAKEPTAEDLGPMRELVSRSLEGVRRIGDLVDSFRSLSAAPGAAPAETIELAALVDECLADMAAPAAGALSFVRELLPGVVARVAREDLRTGLLNVLGFICSQARAEAREHRVLIGTGQENSYRYIRISDPQLRLTEDERTHIFDPRIDVDLRRGRRMQLDVGLAMAYQLLHRNGASLGVQVDGDGGSVFQLQFPGPAAGAP